LNDLAPQIDRGKKKVELGSRFVIFFFWVVLQASSYNLNPQGNAHTAGLNEKDVQMICEFRSMVEIARVKEQCHRYYKKHQDYAASRELNPISQL
jgi:hypothetical protein